MAFFVFMRRHIFNDSIAILRHVNSTIEQNKRDHIASCLDNLMSAKETNVISLKPRNLLLKKGHCR